MLYKALSAAVYGIDASIIEVKVDVSGIKTDEDYFHTVGLPHAALRESRDRVRAAQHGMTARAHDRILKVARTVADLEGAPAIEPKYIAEAIEYRTLDRTFWA